MTLTSNAQQVVQFITAHGASFFEEIVEGTTLLRTQVEQALAELVAQGLVNADSFGGLRALLVPSDRRRTFDGHKRLRRTALFGIEDAGRWALVRRKPALLPSKARHVLSRDRRACRSHPAAPLRRRVLAADRARGGSGCRRGAICCVVIDGSKRAAKFAAGASSPDYRANNLRHRKRSGCCAICGGASHPVR